MSKKTAQRVLDFKQQARLLRAIANETRLKIIVRLYEGPCNVSELVELTKVDQSTISKHLAVLRNSGIVEDQRQGNKVIYHLVTPCVIGFLECSAEVIKERRRSSR